METNNTKTWQIILALIVIGAMVWLIMKKPAVTPEPENSGTADNTTDPSQDPNVASEQLCYIWNTEAGDKAQLAMDIRGTDVMGELNWLPFEKDKKTGVFIGSVSAVDPVTQKRMVNAWWQASAEGSTVSEQLIIKFGGGVANVGFGEMKDDGTGQYVYANPQNLSYEPNLAQTDCGDEAMD